MKIIFLDVDGVLNNLDDFKEHLYDNDDIDYDAPQDKHLKVLKEIINQTGAEVVISSGWRLNLNNFQELIDALYKYNIHVRGVTPEGVPQEILTKANVDIKARNTYERYNGISYEIINHDRGAEIKGWLISHPEYDNVLIIDDEINDIKEYFPYNYIQTNPNKGLLPKHIKLCVDILNSQLN